MFFLVKPINNVKPEGKCRETWKEGLCGCSLQVLRSTRGRGRLVSHCNVTTHTNPLLSLFWSVSAYIFFEEDAIQNHSPPYTQKMQGIAIKEEIKTASFVSLLGYLLFPYGMFSVFQYLKVPSACSEQQSFAGKFKARCYTSTVEYYYLNITILSFCWILACPSLSSKILSLI